MKNVDEKGPDGKKNFWLIKFAPFRTSWEEIIRTGSFTLRGVRSPAARNHLASMRLGDAVLFYQSQKDQAVRGLLEVSRTAYPDPTSADPNWLTCDFRPTRLFKRPVALAELREEPLLDELLLLRQPRLAVLPVQHKHFETILRMSGS